MKRTPWVERKFDFDFPVAHFPFMLERLHGTPPRIEELVKFIPDEILSIKPNGNWSIKEHIGHLTDLEDLHNGRIDDFNNKIPVLRAADMSNKKTIDAGHNKTDVKILLHTFRESRAHFISRLESINEDELSFASLHPRLQKNMRIVDMSFFVAEHDDHHLSIIRELSAMAKNLIQE